MSSNGIDRRQPRFLIGFAAFLVAGSAAGVSLWLAHDGLQVVLAGTVLGLAALVGLVVLYRGRAWRRWSTVLDAYAEREVAREEHGNARQKQTFSSPGRAGQRPRDSQTSPPHLSRG